MVPISVTGPTGIRRTACFLIDTGADCSMLTAELAGATGLELVPVAPEISLTGLGGVVSYSRADCTLRFTTTEGEPVAVPSRYAVGAPGVADSPILGYDLLRHFDLILSRNQGPILLLIDEDGYALTSKGV